MPNMRDLNSTHIVHFDMKAIERYIEKGQSHGNWYQKEAEKILELLTEFSHLPIIRAFAVTSMNTTVEANVHLGVKALLQFHNNIPFTGFLPNQLKYLDLVFSGQDVPGRKIMSFIKALEGDKDAVVVDIWMCRAFGINVTSPSKKQYDFVEQECRNLACVYGVESREVQAMIWAGIKKEKSVISKNISWSELLLRKRGMFSFSLS